jgi:hypothetical protein
MGGGGAKKRPARVVAAGAEADAGWQLPLASPQFSALFEKEVRYALRNAQLRVIAVMAVGLTIVLRLGPVGMSGRGGPWNVALTPYAEGAGAVFSVVYIFMLVSPLSTNLFGYDGAGMRALVLSPVSRRTMLLAKNAAVTLAALLLVTAGVLVGGLVIGDLTPRTLRLRDDGRAVRAGRQLALVAVPEARAVRQADEPLGGGGADAGAGLLPDVGAGGRGHRGRALRREPRPQVCYTRHVRASLRRFLRARAPAPGALA